VPDGSQVRQEFAGPDNPCATGGVVPITYTISLRNGFLVQVAPVLGQLRGQYAPRWASTARRVRLRISRSRVRDQLST
jgi:hypothetical protein